MHDNLNAAWAANALPMLDNGQAGETAPGLVAHGEAHHLTIFWDVVLPFVAALALPLALKYALESRWFSRIFRATPRAPRRAPDAPRPVEDDFDS